MTKYRSGATQDQRTTIRETMEQVVAELAQRTSLPPEAIVLELRYYHQSPSNPYRTTATLKDKKQSFLAHGGKCSNPECAEQLEYSDAVFHHINRGCERQHEPSNLVPLCEACHDEEHGAVMGSIAKGSRR